MFNGVWGSAEIFPKDIWEILTCASELILLNDLSESLSFDSLHAGISYFLPALEKGCPCDTMVNVTPLNCMRIHAAHNLLGHQHSLECMHIWNIVVLLGS